jgi:hypothetical protein
MWILAGNEGDEWKLFGIEFSELLLAVSVKHVVELYLKVLHQRLP